MPEHPQPPADEVPQPAAAAETPAGGPEAATDAAPADPAASVPPEPAPPPEPAEAPAPAPEPAAPDDRPLFKVNAGGRPAACDMNGQLVRKVRPVLMSERAFDPNHAQSVVEAADGTERVLRDSELHEQPKA